MLIRCSNLSDLMTKAKSGNGLSVTAKSLIEKLAIENHYQTPISFSNKYTQKGIECEQDSIDLFNTVYFKNLTKNSQRLENDYITGECDLIDNDLIIDIKTSWDIKTFATQKLSPTDYEWQLRGYMWLYEKDKACTVHCLINTPSHLCKFDNAVHEFDHIPINERLIVGNIIHRDTAKEQAIVEKIEQAREYYQQILAKLQQNQGLPC